jgi:hypothetical protein
MKMGDIASKSGVKLCMNLRVAVDLYLVSPQHEHALYVQISSFWQSVFFNKGNPCTHHTFLVCIFVCSGFVACDFQKCVFGRLDSSFIERFGAIDLIKATVQLLMLSTIKSGATKAVALNNAIRRIKDVSAEYLGMQLLVDNIVRNQFGTRVHPSETLQPFCLPRKSSI